MQEAALQAAVNAAGMTNALLSSITDLDSNFAQTSPDFVAGAIGNTHNLAATAEAILRALPSAAEFTAMSLGGNEEQYFDQFDVTDVAAAAVVLFAADFQASGAVDVATYMGNPPGPLWTYGEYLVRSVMGRPGAVSGALGDFVQALF